MTIRQIMNDAMALTSRSGAPDAVCYAAINRALEEIGRDFPRKAVERICHAPLKPRYASHSERAITSHAPLRISGEGIYSFSLSVYGDGEVSLAVDGEAVREYAVSAKEPLTVALKLSEISSKDCGALLITLQARQTLYLSSVALFDCDSDRAILYRDYEQYCASDFAHRFLAFDGTFLKGTKRVSLPEGYLERDRVLLHSDAVGVYDIGYYALPELVSEENLDEAVFLDGEAQALAVLLTAYYLALEDENSSASEFLSRYEALRARLVGRGEESVGDLYGW